MIDVKKEIRVYTTIFISLLVLLILTVVFARVSFWPFDNDSVKLATALLIAVIKALLVILYFMHIRYSTRLTWIFAGAAFLWLGILITITLCDYTTRYWIPRTYHSDVQIVRPFQRP